MITSPNKLQIKVAWQSYKLAKQEHSPNDEISKYTWCGTLRQHCYETSAHIYPQTIRVVILVDSSQESSPVIGHNSRHQIYLNMKTL